MAVMAPPASPDGGAQAWLRVCAYFVISFCCLGVVYAHGLLVAEWLDTFHESRSLTASVSTLGTATMEGSGVITGLLIARFGEQRCCVAGGLVAGLGLLLSSFATQIWHLHLSFSLLLGFGHSLSLFSGAVLVNRWFSPGSKQALVSGLGNTGSGTGTLCFGVFVPLLIRSRDGSDGWRLALRVLALVTTVLLCGAGLLLRQPTTADLPAPAPALVAAAVVVRKVAAAGDTAAVEKIASAEGNADSTAAVGGGGSGGGEISDVVSFRELLTLPALQPVLAYTFVYAFGLWVPPVPTISE